MKEPLVTVIVICYNHDKYVVQAIQSVLDQDYQNIEIIIADDASTDQSVEKILELVSSTQSLIFLPNEENIGNCKTFNKAFSQSSGEYILDLSADDALDSSRVRRGVELLQERGPEYGVHYCDAWLVNENDTLIGLHSKSSGLIEKDPFPEGYIFSKLLKRYFICPPTLMATRSVFESLNGYDETLSYEDFDFLIRSSKNFDFCASQEPLVIRRVLENSKSSVQSAEPKYYRSTLEVCKKAISLTDTKEEKSALATRVLFESWQASKRKQYDMVIDYLKLMDQLNVPKWRQLVYKLLMKTH